MTPSGGRRVPVGSGSALLAFVVVVTLAAFAAAVAAFIDSADWAE